MSQAAIVSYIKLDLTMQDYVLVGKGLTGQLHGKDVYAAAELNVKLTTQVAKHAAERAEIHQGVVARAQEVLDGIAGQSHTAV